MHQNRRHMLQFLKAYTNCNLTTEKGAISPFYHYTLFFKVWPVSYKHLELLETHPRSTQWIQAGKEELRNLHFQQHTKV